MLGITDIRQVAGYLKELGQSTPADTNAATLYSLPTKKIALITLIVITNTSNGALTYRLFADRDGTTYSTATALEYDVAIAANTTVYRDLNLPLSNTGGGSIGIRSSSANNITFTAYGMELKR